MGQDNRCPMNRSDNTDCRCSKRTVAFFSTLSTEPSAIAVAVAMPTRCPASDPSPRTSPGLNIPTTASFPDGDRGPH